jgi:sRNA-binding carbon storage regulator CsrA
MLVLSRRRGEALLITVPAARTGDATTIALHFFDVGTRGGAVSVGVDAPSDVHVVRGELRKDPQSAQILSRGRRA